MIKNLVLGEWKKEVSRELVFDDGEGNGYAFPCEKDGTPILNKCSQKSYDFCIAHPKNFVRFNELVENVRHYKENSKGTCKCGETVKLIDKYMGACQCPKCGRWYNVFGQELLPPEMWED